MEYVCCFFFFKSTGGVSFLRESPKLIRSRILIPSFPQPIHRTATKKEKTKQEHTSVGWFWPWTPATGVTDATCVCVCVARPSTFSSRQNKLDAVWDVEKLREVWDSTWGGGGGSGRGGGAGVLVVACSFWGGRGRSLLHLEVYLSVWELMKCPPNPDRVY